ncbi:MAG: LLM class flavin-dependent oxidoreductase [Pseudomonadales bacterium]
MQIGVGLDGTLALSWDDQATLAREAAELGYTSIWTNEGTGLDAYQVCSHRWAASCDVVPGGITTGIAVSPVMYRSPMALAMSGGTLSQRTNGKFIMGIGTGGAYRPRARKALGYPRVSSLALMRDYLTVLRKLLDGELVDYAGDAVTLKQAQLTIHPPPRTPLYLGSLGPEMLRLAGVCADGVCLNWCSPTHVAWSRERINEGVKIAVRQPSDVQMVQYIRICIDDDVDASRRALVRATIGYALGMQVPTERERQFGYRAHFERMGFADELAMLDDMRRSGASMRQIVDAFPNALLNAVGYYGPPDGAAEAFRRLAEGLDTAIVRVVPAKPGIDAVRAVMKACQP